MDGLTQGDEELAGVGDRHHSGDCTLDCDESLMINTSLEDIYGYCSYISSCPGSLTCLRAREEIVMT